MVLQREEGSEDEEGSEEETNVQEGMASEIKKRRVMVCTVTDDGTKAQFLVYNIQVYNQRYSCCVGINDIVATCIQ